MTLLRPLGLALRWASRVLERWAFALLRRTVPRAGEYRYTVTVVDAKGEPADIAKRAPPRIHRWRDLPPGTKL